MPIEGTWNIKYVEDTTMFEKPKILELNLTYSELTRDADNKVVEFKPRNDRFYKTRINFYADRRYMNQ